MLYGIVDGKDEDVETDKLPKEELIRIRKAPEKLYLQVGEYGNGVYGNEVLLGHGDVTNENCGKFVRYMGCDRLDLHVRINLDGKSYEGKVYVRMGFNYCHKPSCPKCFKHGFAVQLAERANARVQNYQNRKGSCEHIVISVPIKDYKLTRDELRKKAIEILISLGVIGGGIIFHGFRFATVQESIRRNVPDGWYWSPHFHVVGRILGGYSKCRLCKYWMNRDCKKGCGGFNDRAYWECYEKKGYYVKVLGARKDFFGTFWYQANHASYDKTKKRHQIMYWFGDLANRKMRVTPEKQRQLCPICKHELKPMLYVGCDSIVFNWLKHDGYFDYFDSAGRQAWVETEDKWYRCSGSSEMGEDEVEVKLHEAIRMKDRVVVRVKEGHGDLDEYTKEEIEAYDAYIEDMFPKGGDR